MIPGVELSAAEERAARLDAYRCASSTRTPRLARGRTYLEVVRCNRPAGHGGEHRYTRSDRTVRHEWAAS